MDELLDICLHIIPIALSAATLAGSIYYWRARLKRDNGKKRRT